MPFRRVPLIVTSLLSLVIALCFTQIGLTQQAHAAVKGPARAVSASAAAPGSRSSGSDSSCPAASPAAAGSSTVSAPQAVRAIRGDGSATVVWCPPASGAGSVVSYTVTSSGGQSVTATVPDDWAIVQGLTNGTSYTFTVTANTGTAGSSGPASPATAPVTPATPAPPADVLRSGPSQQVTYDASSLLIGGKRVFITAGEFDPWRTPSPSLWLDDLQKMKADGYNAVTVYFDWDYSSPSPGVYDFGGVRDMNEFLNMAQEAGLYVIARPGPYINAETDGGGIPSWVLNAPNGYRTDSQPYLSASEQWLAQIDAIIAPHQITKGGDVILYQIENEYTGRSTGDLQYLADLEQQAKADGITVPFTFNQCCGGPFYTSGTGAVNISGPDNYPLGFNCSNPNGFGQPYGYPTQSGEPLYLPEFQGGSFDGWGGAGYDNCYNLTGPAFENVYYKNNIAQGVTMQSNYMGVGGTNWGWLPYPGVYTSYDYGAAIRETGEIGTPANPNSIVGSKFGENKLINDFETSVAPLTNTQPVAAPAADNSAITTLARANPNDGTQFVYVRQADATSTSTVSTHLALNADETAGYTYDDANTSLTYSGNWTHANTSNANYTAGDYDSTESWSTQAGATMSVTFTGTAVQWIGAKNNNGGIADVAIDGTQVGTVDTYAAAGKEFQQVLFSQSGLSAGSHTLTITVTGNKDSASSADTVVVDAINVPTAAQLADYYPTVPQSGTLTLDGRDSRLLLANYTFGGGEHLVYSTSELMTQGDIGGQATAVLYDPDGTDGETVLRYASQPVVSVLSGTVQASWDASRGDLRLDYTHHGLAEVQITEGGAPPLRLLIASTGVAEELWPEATSAGDVLVQGGYLVRTAAVRGASLALTGDTSQSGPLTVWAPPGVHAVTWNGRPVAVTTGQDGSLTGTVPGPAPVHLPTLTGWKFSSEAPEAQPGFDDSSWTLADHPVSNSSSGSPALYASDYGYQHGFTWYRGHFTATGNETGVKLTADGVSPTGAYSVWLNGAFLGSANAAGASTQTFTFPASALRSGQDNVLAVLVENTGNPEGPTGEKTGLYSATLTGATTPITWRLMGTPGGVQLQDPARGIMNEAGLYGSNHGWDLPGYPDQSWQSVSLPDSWSSRGVPPGIGWYRTSFSLNLPRGGYVPVDVQIGGPGPGAGSADYRAFIYVNGWLIGRYVNNVGPQHQFYVPAGLLNDQGSNTLAIAVWGMDATGGGLDQVSLVAAGNQAGGVPVRPVLSPGYSAAVYGPPSSPQPTLAAVPSSALAEGTFSVKATLRNPTMQPLRNASILLNAPAGWQVSPSSPAALGTVAPGAAGSASFKVTAPSSGQSPGLVGLLAKATFSSAAGNTQTLINSADVSVPAPNLASTFDNTGVTDDSNPSPSANFEGFDGEGTTYSAQGLAADNLTPGASVTAGGLTFTWPNEPSAQPDNTMAEGQTIAVSGSGSTLGFLAAANNSPESGTGTIYYTDGSTQTFTLSVGNFWYASGQNGNPSNTQVAGVNYANYPTGSSGHEVYLFEQSVSLQSGKTVEAVTLPSLGDVAGYNPALHIFAIAVG